jgi:hypothetical protein
MGHGAMLVVQTLYVIPTSEAFRVRAEMECSCRDRAARRCSLRPGRLFELLQDHAQIKPRQRLFYVYASFSRLDF